MENTDKQNQNIEKKPKLKDVILNENVIGKDAIIFLINNQMEMGKITDLSKYEIEITKRDGTKRIIFKGSIISIEIK